MRAGELYPGDDPELNRELGERQELLEALNSIPTARGDERRRALSEEPRTGACDEPGRATARLERQLLEIERESAGRAYDENRLTDEARRRIEREMDLEEARIANRETDGGHSK